uniref:Uncharacterized protein n=1 Tax=Rhizophora mucronata TaxID=61149 RepID=A0A2P2P9Y4_RHIMU
MQRNRDKKKWSATRSKKEGIDLSFRFPKCSIQI